MRYETFLAFACSAIVIVAGAGAMYFVTSREGRSASLATEARSWSTSVGFQVVGVYCYGDAVCDVSVGSAESMRVLYLHCVPGEGCVPR